ncbi:MAG: ABC transporter ATP-binding protein [Ruminococcaceae bacterium]|nr:ABC transporter ATP-binding protein [Oscillospiraceae bacterium]
MRLFGKKRSYLNKDSLREVIEETRWIYRHTRAYKKAIISYVLLGLLTTAFSMIVALASKELVNSIVYLKTIEGYGGSRIMSTGIIVVLLSVGNILLGAFVGRYSAKINLRINNELRAEVYETFMNTDWQSLQEFHSGDLLSRINTDVTTVANSVLGWVPTLVIKGSLFLSSLVIILIYDPTMAFFALLSAPVTLLIAKPFVGKMRRFSRDMRDISAEMTAFHEESLQNAQNIKAFNLVDTFLVKLHSVQEKFYNVSMDYHRFSILNSSLLSAVGMVVSYLCFGWGAYRLWMGKIDFGTMVLFIQLAGYLSSALTALIKLVPSAIECTVAAHRIMTIFDLPAENIDERNEVEAVKRSMQPISICMKDLNFSYQNRSLVLNDLQLQVAPHEMIAIVGPSGSGKTTLFRIMLGLLSPTEGSASVHVGEKTFALSPSTRTLFSYVPQDNIIFSGTIAEMLRQVRPDATDEQLYNALRIACAEDFVRKLPDGLYCRMRERGSSLSLGQNQRLSIARAILADAPILLLDEVTSALDLQTERKVLQNIASLQNKTCIISTHRPSVLSLCDTVYRIRNTKFEVLPEEELKQMQKTAPA